ncbi:MAG: DUF3667 domain-containing protein [Chitinophagaceae bacterium]|nr:DUF3667 domain-containing protein [Chitinophagaceae bacterium]MCW5906054.1 DUF3667 domain-containing protein [Chitinophagaceae bacterium]
MSHAKERQEKKCLNCEAELHGRYCHVCGQENIEIKENLWSLIVHFVEDITHFDGKFYKTIKVLLLKPGFLSAEYIKGKRATYFHPIRMYVFTSFFFFLIYFSFYQGNHNNASSNKVSIDNSEIAKKRDSLADSVLKDIYTSSNYTDSTKSNSRKSKYTLKEYDSLIKVGAIDDNWLEQKFIRKSIYLEDKYQNNKGQILTDFFQKFTHSFPQVLFITLPLIAFLLKLLYIRRREFYFVHHAIFTIHIYCASFIIILLSLWIGSLLHYIHLNNGIIAGLIDFIIYALSFIYLYKSLRNFYQQKRIKTFLKYMILLFFSLFIYLFAFLLMFTFTVMTL